MASPADLDITTRRWRRIEYERLVELGMFTGERLELLNGLLVVREPQGSPHASSVAQVARVLERAFGPGWHARQHAPLALDDDSEPEPDVAMVRGEPHAYYAGHPGTAALVVEVADSSLRLDRRLKTELYARNRLPEYWIVNLTDATLEIHRDPHRAPSAGWHYAAVEILRPPATVTPLGAPHSVVAVAELLPPHRD
ncbi:MAG TPA: Uma2 family endonuclease [Methylomirabilota bacterium]|jgi:Uma2 family endonuclease